MWALRFGEKMVLKYNWWIRSKSVGKLFEIELNDGDGYLMSEKVKRLLEMIGSKRKFILCVIVREVVNMSRLLNKTICFLS